jgi:hypothetical protein
MLLSDSLRNIYATLGPAPCCGAVQGEDAEEGEEGAQEGEEESDGHRVLEKYVGVKVRHWTWGEENQSTVITRADKQPVGTGQVSLVAQSEHHTQQLHTAQTAHGASSAHSLPDKMQMHRPGGRGGDGAVGSGRSSRQWGPQAASADQPQAAVGATGSRVQVRHWGLGVEGGPGGGSCCRQQEVFGPQQLSVTHSV